MTRPHGRDTKGVVLGKQQRSDDAVRVSVRYLKYTFIACAHALKIVTSHPTSLSLCYVYQANMSNFPRPSDPPF